MFRDLSVDDRLKWLCECYRGLSIVCLSRGLSEIVFGSFIVFRYFGYYTSAINEYSLTVYSENNDICRLEFKRALWTLSPLVETSRFC